MSDQKKDLTLSGDYDPLVIKAQLVMAERMAQSKLIPYTLHKKPHDILIILQQGRELNIPPMQALNGINVIQGKPTVSPQLMLAMIYRGMPNALIEFDLNEKDSVAIVTMARAGGVNKYTSTWSLDRANKMGLTGKDNWKKQPMTMLKWRAVSDAARIVFPDIISGIYTTEEFDGDSASTTYNDDGSIAPADVDNTVYITEQQIYILKELCKNAEKKDEWLRACLRRLGKEKLLELTADEFEVIRKTLIDIIDKIEEKMTIEDRKRQALKADHQRRVAEGIKNTKPDNTYFTIPDMPVDEQGEDACNAADQFQDSVSKDK